MNSRPQEPVCPHGLQILLSYAVLTTWIECVQTIRKDLSREISTNESHSDDLLIYCKIVPSGLSLVIMPFLKKSIYISTV